MRNTLSIENTSPSTALPLSLRAATLAMVFGAAYAQPASDATLPAIKATASAERDNTSASTGAPFDAALRDVPQSLTILDRRMLDAQAATSLKDALRNVPGITLGAGEGGVIGDNINLRGFSARTDVYLDGLRDRGQYARDVFALEAVEVLKGPSSMLFGRGSTGGVINQVSKKPDLSDRSEVSLSAGTDDLYRTTLDVNRRVGEDSAMRVAAFGQSIQSTRDVTRADDIGVAPSFRWGIGTASELALSALLQRNHDIPDYGFPLVTTSGTGTVRTPVHAPRNTYYGYTDDLFDQSVNVATASWQYQWSESTKLRARVMASHDRTNARANPLGTVVRTGGGTPSLNDDLDDLSAPRSTRDRQITDDSLIGQLDLTGQVNVAGLPHQMTGGIEWANERSRDDRWAWNTPASEALVNLGQPIYRDISGGRALSRTTITTADTIAAYVNDAVQLAPDWKLVAGLRGERFAVRSELTKYALPPGFPADTTQPALPKSETMWSPRAGIIWQPTEAQSWYASYGTSFNPSAEAVSQSASTSTLDAEKNRSFELGGKLDILGGDLSLAVAAFRVEKTNPRTTDAAGTNVTEGLIRVDGFELGATGRLTPAWEVFAGYTYLDGRIIESPQIGTGQDSGIAAQGKAAPNTPRHNATMWTTWRFASNWELGGGAQLSSERWLNNFQSAKVDGYTRWDATLAWHESPWEVRLNLQNLTDATYFEASSAGRATPVRGRTALVTATWRF